MPDRRSTAFQAAGAPLTNVYLILIPTHFFSIATRKPLGKTWPVIGSAVTREFTVQRVQRSSSKCFSTGEKVGPAEGWCWENTDETGAMWTPAPLATWELLRKCDFYTFWYIIQPHKVLSYC